MNHHSQTGENSFSEITKQRQRTHSILKNNKSSSSTTTTTHTTTTIISTTNSTTGSVSNSLLDLPDALLYQILTYVAHPLRKVSVLIYSIGSLNWCHYKDIHHNRSSLWETILVCDYAIYSALRPSTRIVAKRKRQTPQPPPPPPPPPPPRRKSKRLGELSTLDQIRRTHEQLWTRTQTVHFYLTEVCHSKRTPLTLAHLRRLMRTYGPILLINSTSPAVSTTFLTECCKARHVKECVIKQCVFELINKHGADPNATNQDYSSVPTPLCIASARAMPTVVQCLLHSGARTNVASYGSFRLYSNSNKCVRGMKNPLEFALSMKHAELQFGIEQKDLASLQRCISILQRHNLKAAKQQQ